MEETEIPSLTGFCVWLHKRHATHTLRAVRLFIEKEGRNGAEFVATCREMAQKELEAINRRRDDVFMADMLC